MMQKQKMRGITLTRARRSSLTVGVVTGVLFVIASLVYVVFSQAREEIIFMLSAFVGWGAVYSAYFVGETLRVP